MANLFENLMVTKKLSFEPGKITLINQRELMTSALFFAEYSMRINDDTKMLRELYDSAKVSYRNGTATNLGKHYAISSNDLLQWMTNLANFTGWGKLTWHSYIEESKSGVIFIEDLPIPALLKGKVHGCVDHIARGFIAGGASAILNADIDAVEEECVAMGAAQCKFVFMPKEKFKKTAETERQLGI
ncbi:MAG: 4-vinyl reductase [Candidatus Micrarchaeota archaeon]|nr:4-vinyl reductase [Candidatus Micrarchaeota archaeon]